MVINPFSFLYRQINHPLLYILPFLFVYNAWHEANAHKIQAGKKRYKQIKINARTIPCHNETKSWNFFEIKRTIVNK